MPLADDLARLQELQEIDAGICRAERALKALDTGESLKQRAVALLKDHDVAQARREKAGGVLRDRELELKGLEMKRAAVHEKLYGGRITNPKELGDLQRDEEMLSQQIGRLEEAVLELMDQAEGARAEAERLAAELAEAKRRWKETVAHTQAETVRLQRELATLGPERERRAARVSKLLLRRYDEIRAHREGIGLAGVETGACALCHVKLDAETLRRVRQLEEVVMCLSCGRILAGQG